MFKDKEKLYQIYHTILSMALTWALTLVCNHYYGFKINIVICAVFSFLPGIGIYLFDSNRKNALRYIILGSFIPIIALLFYIRKVNPISWISDIIQWCEIYDGTEKLYHSTKAHFVILFIALAASIILYLLLKKQIAKFILAAVLLVALILLSVNKVDINKAVVGISLFYILSIMIELYGIVYSKKSGRPDKKEGILYLAPICLLISILAIGLPSKPEPIKWTFFVNIYHNIKNNIDLMMTDIDYYMGRGMDEFRISFSGYSDDNGNLGGGSIKNDEKVALNVSGAQGGNSIYLIGSVSDLYTGNSWEKSNKNYKSKVPDYLLDYLELGAALSRLDKDTLENNRFVERKQLKLKYYNIKTKTLFYPLKSSWVDNLKGVKEPNYDFSNIKFKKAVGNGTTYQYLYYELNLQGDAFQKMLRDADKFSYQDNNIVHKGNLEWIEQHLLYEDNVEKAFTDMDYSTLLKERADSIKKQYTVLPDSLPTRVKELSKQITEKYDTDYDRLKAIETFLKGYTYSVNPGSTPKDRDFADYFLFDTKKGYCTSFATSMAILARCVGIPTRYVEGYVANFDQSDEDGLFPIKNSQAHAWAEAYIDGIGWIPFEATQPYYEKRYTKWAEFSKDVDENDSYHYSSEMSNYDRDQMLKKYQQEKNNIKAINKKRHAGYITGLVIVILTIMILFLILMIYYRFLKMRYHKEFKKADNNRRMYLMFLRILRLLKREGFTLEPQDTVLMLAQRIKDRYQFEKVIFPEIAEIYMKNRYGEKEITKEDLDKVGVFYHGLDLKRKEELSKFKIVVEEFIFLTKNNFQ